VEELLQIVLERGAGQQEAVTEEGTYSEKLSEKTISSNGQLIPEASVLPARAFRS